MCCRWTEGLAASCQHLAAFAAKTPWHHLRQKKKDDLKGPDLQERSMEGDDGALAVLANMEQGSKEVRDHEDEAINQVSDIEMQMAGCDDVISQCRLLSQEVCPQIPLCRMVAHAVVRGIRSELSSLKSAFQYEGYLPEKGSFLVSTCKYDGEETSVTTAIQSSWSPLWREVDAEFEKEVLSKPEFKFLSEIALLTRLQRVNAMNEYAIVKPSLRDILWNCNNIFKCDINAFLSALPQDQVEVLQSLRAKDTSIKGKQQWYPLTRGYLARLVFQVEYTSELNKIEDLVSSTISAENKEKTLKKERAKIHKRLSDRMGMVLNVLDPKLGDQWLARIFALKFDSPDSVITLGKLRSLANAEMREEKRLLVLSLLDSNKRLKDMYGMPSTDNEFRLWLAQECFLEKVEVEAIQSLEDLKNMRIIGTRLDLPQDYSLQDYLEGIKLEARKYMFAQVRAREQAMDARTSRQAQAPKQRKRNEVIMAAYRVVFRYLCHLIGEKKLTRLPDHCKGWIDKSNEGVCMYPKSMQNLSEWEIEHCPWWVDLGSGFVLAREKKLHKVHRKKEESTVAERCSIRSRKETTVVQEEKDNTPLQDDVEPTNSLQGDHKVVAKEFIPFVFIPFVFIPCPLNDLLPKESDATSYGCMVGDYLSMGKDFVAGIRSDAYKVVHEFFSKLGRNDSTYIRNGKPVKWASDLVFIDFPTGCFINKETTMPTWNVLTEAHIRMGITVAAASLRDSGWLVVWITLIGDALPWLEKYIHVLGLEVVRRVFVLDKLPCSYDKECGMELVVRSSLLVFARRTGCCPPTFLEESGSYFCKLQIDPLSDCWTHYLPEGERLVQSSPSTLWRGGLQRCCGSTSYQRDKCEEDRGYS
ncbi:hypothetical protein GOP47_0024647 [Adiantum capillus-veneris]|uniref:Uncharacterized protein n=1 Tax=Adiantum capillus-veneris TaxID=13818 RepID=A0A9D4U2M9_ADICA|nr:hypothetical protein GOP47_0024647 [Adiantum capillus-veneris]